MKQPEGFHNGKKDMVCLLKTALYGLKQSPRQWYKGSINLRRKLILIEATMILFIKMEGMVKIKFFFYYLLMILMIHKEFSGNQDSENKT